MTNEVRYLAQHLLHQGLGPLCERDRRVIARVARRIHHTRNLNLEFEERLTLGERLADRVASVGGSWGFIIACVAFLFGWAGLNIFILAERAFDPYPFILLNLVLSMIAALQAPVIMMSQNRQAAKDRLAAALDYEVNIKSETAIADLHEKMERMQASVERLAAAVIVAPAAPANDQDPDPQRSRA